MARLQHNPGHVTMTSTKDYDQYYLSYSGAGLPLNLVSPIEQQDIRNRNTFFGAMLDREGRISLIHKRVYGEIELSHCYEYYPDGQLKQAEIHNIEDEGIRLNFDPGGKITAQEEIPEQK